jgi:hypothetical protein
MFELIEKIKGDVLALKITGEIEEKEKSELTRIVEKRIKERGSIRILIAAEHYPSFNSAEDLYSDLNFVVRFSSEIERMAVVGDRPWKSTWVALFGLFSSIDARYFSKEDFEEAWQWLTGN